MRDQRPLGTHVETPNWIIFFHHGSLYVMHGMACSIKQRCCEEVRWVLLVHRTSEIMFFLTACSTSMHHATWTAQHSQHLHHCSEAHDYCQQPNNNQSTKLQRRPKLVLLSTQTTTIKAKHHQPALSVQTNSIRAVIVWQTLFPCACSTPDVQQYLDNGFRAFEVVRLTTA